MRLGIEQLEERKMVKAEVIQELALQKGLSIKDAGTVVDTVLKGIAASLAKGELVEIRGFGCFDIRKRDAWTGRNPKTGELVQVPAKRTAFFKAGKELRERVDSRYPMEQRLKHLYWEERSINFYREHDGGIGNGVCLLVAIPDSRCGNHQLESRVRENRMHGSKGWEVTLPVPYFALLKNDIFVISSTVTVFPIVTVFAITNFCRDSLNG
ncbi:MAG: integration host factor subunit beta [Magnetococcus sp. DMHC-6]